MFRSSLFDMNTSKVQRLSPWELITTLVPLLIDTWHEATSGEPTTSSSEQFDKHIVICGWDFKFQSADRPIAGFLGIKLKPGSC